MEKGGLSKLLFIKLILCFPSPEITSLDFKLKIGQQYIKVKMQKKCVSFEFANGFEVKVVCNEVFLPKTLQKTYSEMEKT